MNCNLLIPPLCAAAHQILTVQRLNRRIFHAKNAAHILIESDRTCPRSAASFAGRCRPPLTAAACTAHRACHDLHKLAGVPLRRCSGAKLTACVAQSTCYRAAHGQPASSDVASATAAEKIVPSRTSRNASGGSFSPVVRKYAERSAAIHNAAGRAENNACAVPSPGESNADSAMFSTSGCSARAMRANTRVMTRSTSRCRDRESNASCRAWIRPVTAAISDHHHQLTRAELPSMKVAGICVVHSAERWLSAPGGDRRQGAPRAFGILTTGEMHSAGT